MSGELENNDVGDDNGTAAQTCVRNVNMAKECKTKRI